MTPVAVDLAASEGMHRLPLFASFWSDGNVNSSIVFKSMTQREWVSFPAPQMAESDTGLCRRKIWLLHHENPEEKRTFESLSELPALTDVPLCMPLPC